MAGRTNTRLLSPAVHCPIRQNDKATMAKATMAGSSGFLAKPFYPAELQSTVELALCAFGDTGIVPPPPEEREIPDLFEDQILVSSRTSCHRIAMETIL
jgi:DNA-binding response OmpR family regulator